MGAPVAADHPPDGRDRPGADQLGADAADRPGRYAEPPRMLKVASARVGDEGGGDARAQRRSPTRRRFGAVVAMVAVPSLSLARLRVAGVGGGVLAPEGAVASSDRADDGDAARGAWAS